MPRQFHIVACILLVAQSAHQSAHAHEPSPAPQHAPLSRGSPLPAAAVMPAAQDAIRAEDVRHAIRSGSAWLKRRQLRNGAWPHGDERFQSGATALAALSLLNAGVSPDDPDLLRGLRFVAESNDSLTYNLALKIAALAAADPNRYRAEIETATRRLVAGQLEGGSWTYGIAEFRAIIGRGDNSNTQFALYGLHEAARVGVKINRTVWIKASKYWTSTQCADGGWAYLGSQATGYGSMTAAGVASLLICGNTVNTALEHGYRNGAAENCGKYATPPALARGLKWLGENFDVRRNPRHPAYPYYWLYALERAGMLSGLKHMGKHDWYREGAAQLVNSQSANGSWNNSDLDTAFALLFIAKGRRPVILNKLAWSRDQKWNPDRHDCENLTAFLGDKLGEMVTWQTVALDAAVEDWMEAPILYFNGHEFPAFSRDEKERLRRFVDAGGTIFAEACCSRAAFRKGFESFVAGVFAEYPLTELGREHPIWRSLFKLEPGNFRLMGLDSGCRTSVIFAPMDLSCLWEQAGAANPPAILNEALELGANIAAYVTGREPLRDKLDEIVLADEHKSPANETDKVGALRIAQIMYDGDWRPDPGMLPSLAELLNKNASVDVIAKPATLRLGDAALLEHPIAYMTGHYSFRLSKAEQEGLRAYLARGGYLFAEACCGRKAFDTSFREMTRELFPRNPLTPVPPDHELLRGNPGYNIRRIAYRPGLAREQPDLTSPRLESVTVDDRLVILYSPFGIGCGVEGHQCFNCRGVSAEDARKLAVNAVLFGLSH